MKKIEGIKLKEFTKALSLIVVLVWGGASGAHSTESFNISDLKIVSGSRSHVFKVEVAETPEQRSLGLQWRKQMAVNQGMLFDFENSIPVTMWMKNTYLSLDMFFISADGTIINIARDTTPLSLGYINSAGPAQGVLEVLAGTAKRLGIKAGDKIIHARFQK